MYHNLILYVAYATWSVHCLQLPDHPQIEELHRMLIEERLNQVTSPEQQSEHSSKPFTIRIVCTQIKNFDTLFTDARFYPSIIDFNELNSQQKDGLCNLVINTMLPCIADIEILPPSINEWTPLEKHSIQKIGISKNMFPCVRRKINFNYAQLMKYKYEIPKDDLLEPFLLSASVTLLNTVYAFKPTRAGAVPKFRLCVDTAQFLPFAFIDKEIKDYTTVNIVNDRVVGSY